MGLYSLARNGQNFKTELSKTYITWIKYKVLEKRLPR